MLVLGGVLLSALSTLVMEDDANVASTTSPIILVTLADNES